MKPLLTDLRTDELRVALEEKFGGPGQYNGPLDGPNRFYLPLAGPTCQVVLTFRGSEIIGTEPGPALDASAWAHLCNEIERSVQQGAVAIGRDVSFSRYRVTGSWRGARSGVQILPPPADAPMAPVAMADHPFILEFGIRRSDLWPLTNHRRLREHRLLTRLLNLLLRGGASSLPQRLEHFWAAVPRTPTSTGFDNIQWVQRFFFANLGEVVRDDPSPLPDRQLEEVDADAYYGTLGHDGGALRVPSDLDTSITLYKQLDATARAKLDRSLFWLDLASRQWVDSVSASFASLVTAIESLTPGAGGPGATERFRAFFEEFAPGADLMSRRNNIYKLRSGILHGGRLMQLDQGPAFFGWHPPEFDERELHSDLWSLTRVALRHWLRNPPRG